jgi:hypothetical protein
MKKDVICLPIKDVKALLWRYENFLATMQQEIDYQKKNVDELKLKMKTLQRKQAKRSSLKK